MKNHVVENTRGKKRRKDVHEANDATKGWADEERKKKKRKKRTRMHDVDLDRRWRSTGCLNPMHLQFATRAWKRTRRKTRNLRVGS